MGETTVRKHHLVYSLVAASAIVAAACSSSSSSTSAAGTSTTSSDASGSTIAATERDFEITIDPSTASAGEVTFNITNEGPSTHEFVVVQSDLAEAKLPVKEQDAPPGGIPLGVVNEDAVTVVDEAEDITPSTTTDLTVDLDAGTYIIICNVLGHYETGRHTKLTVS
jgi:uncharacterized cupredoxin-like copper-binding protein